MQKIFLCTIMILIGAHSFSQQISDDRKLAQQNYLQKSKNKKTAGFIFLGSGVGMVILSAAIPRGELVHDGICIGPLCSDEYKNDGIKGALFLVGVASTLTSLPFFIASRKNRNKAAAISLTMEKTPFTYTYNAGNILIPALRLKVSL